MSEPENHPLRMLAAAVAGRQVAITYLLSPEARSYTDGDRLFLATQRSREERRVELMVQAALLAGGALETAGLRGLIGRAELRQRYLLLEVERCCARIADRLPVQLLARLARFRSGWASASAADSLRIARSTGRLPSPPPWFGTLQPWRALRRSLQGGGAPLTRQRLQQLEARLREMQADAEDDDDSLNKSSFWHLLSSPLGRDNMFARFMQEILDMRSSPQKDSGTSGAEGSSELLSARVSTRIRDITSALRSGLAIAIPSGFIQAEPGAHSYPEWDFESRRYRPNWVNVEEVEPHAAESALGRAALAGDDRDLQRSLARLCLGVRRHRGQPQGDDLVLDRMVRLIVDLRTGYSGDERIYSAHLRTRRDLGVQILLDASSSTLEHDAGGVRVFDLQVQAARMLCRAFALLGDRVALHGFHSWGRTLVRFQAVKDFDEVPGAAMERRLEQLAVVGYTRCGAAVRHATARLKRRAGTPFQLLIVISDGYPYDDQYEGEYAIADTHKAIEEAGARGIACVCLSVGGDAERERLERVYGAANYLAIRHARQMATRLRPLVAGALGATRRAA